jgi:enoyl-CoA hydratase/carnithine racemase
MSELVYREVLYEANDPIATITLHRPEVLNAWTRRMGLEVAHAMARAEHDPEVVGIILTGAGRGFCSGADMNRLSRFSEEGPVGDDVGAQQLSAAPGDPTFGEDFRGEFSYLMSVPKPIVAAINGPVAGIGVAIALACDLRFMAEDAALTTAFSQRGLIAEGGISWLLPRLVGSATALDLLYSGRKVTGTEAAQLGLVNLALPGDAVLSHSRRYIEELADKCSPASLAAMKRQVYQQLHVGLGPASREAYELTLVRFRDPDFNEGVKSFRERRAPRFKRLGQ